MSIIKNIECPDCKGKGYQNLEIDLESICPQCEGKGFVIVLKFWKGKEVTTENVKLCRVGEIKEN